MFTGGIFPYCGEGGIRTHDNQKGYSRSQGVRYRPLCHLTLAVGAGVEPTQDLRLASLANSCFTVQPTYQYLQL